ncbi:TetR/AcrR family transcriptional regulator [Larkinella sp. VNQ87]|uniref:TetR/AcrR family transcriptional regulator n=1 Tax=Larkinella sp. VNQ87 TaxID=3400921 RepID=UPI003BFF500E
MDKTARILETALKLFVEYGFHGTPTSRIASEAGVSNGTLFHYFKTKDELVVALYNTIKEELNQFLARQTDDTAPVKEKFRRLFIGSVEWSLDNREAFYFLQQFRFSPHLSLISEEDRHRQTELHNRLLREAIQANILKPLPPDLLAALIDNQLYGLHQYLVKQPEAVDRQSLIKNVFELTWKMVANPEQP